MTGAVWETPLVNSPERLALARELHISPVTAQILLNRGVFSAATARAFLEADPANLLPPELIPGLPEARERLLQAVKKQEKVLIYGDYDVDGLAAAAIMVEILSRLGVEYLVYLPDRLAEGYGLKKKGLVRALETGCRLVVTVDCGITSLEEAAFAWEQGLDLVITDHHRPGVELPRARAIVHPLLAADLPLLCGAGVAFKLAQSLAASSGLAPWQGVAAGWSLDLAALATIADAVPLTGENRLLVQLGLRAMAGNLRPGLKALAEIAGLPAREWTAREVAFGLVPRLNACGRLGSAYPGLELLLATSAQQALELARRLEGENRARRLLEETTAAQAGAMAMAALAEGDKGLVLAAETWHPGVIGIVAARLAERFNCPVVLIALAGDRGRGSGRSVPGINLHALLARCQDHLLAFGGHSGAAGLEIASEKVPAFRAAFNAALQAAGDTVQVPPAVVPEAEVLFSQLDLELLEELEKLAPHGEGNPRPLLLYRNARLVTARQVGNNGAHLKMTLAGEGRQLDAIGFNLQLPDGLAPGAAVDLAFYLDRDSYQGEDKVQLRLAALRPAGRPKASISSFKELVAATGAGTGGAPWCRQLDAALDSNEPTQGVLFATSLAVRQCFYGMQRCPGNLASLRPLGPWLGREGVRRTLSRSRGIITCHPFWPPGEEGEEFSFLVSPVVGGYEKIKAGRLLLPASDPAGWQLFPALLPLLVELLGRGQNVLLYEEDGRKMLRQGALLQQEMPGVRLAVDAFFDKYHLLLAREEALSGRMPLLVARREMPAWFYPADAVIFNYFPASLEEIELALPAGVRVPSVYLNPGQGARQEENLRRELAGLYRSIQKVTNRGKGLYIINSRGYHQRWYLAILEELGLIRVERRGQELAVYLLNGTTGKNLLASRRYRQLLAETGMAREFYQQVMEGR